MTNFNQPSTHIVELTVGNMKMMMRCMWVFLLTSVLGVGCSIRNNIEKEKEDPLTDNIDDKVISNIILYQYGKELSSWKALSPKASR